MFDNKLMRIYGRRGENNTMEENKQALEFKTQLCDSIRNAGLAYLTLRRLMSYIYIYIYIYIYTHIWSTYS